MKPLSYLLLVALTLATGGQAVVHGNRNGYRYNGPSHKYLPAEGAPSTDAITTTGHWQPHPQAVEEQDREQQQQQQHQQLGYLSSQYWKPFNQQEAALGQKHQQGYHRQEQQAHLQQFQPLQEVEYLIHQQKPQGFSQYQGNRQSGSSIGQQQQQQQPENAWDSASHNYQQQESHKQQQQQQPENAWHSSSSHKQQLEPQQAENHWNQQKQDSRQSYWDSSFGQQQQQQKKNNWESSYGQQQQQQPENHWSGSLSSNHIQSHQQQQQQPKENNWESSYQGSHQQQQQPENHWSGSQANRWQSQPTHSHSHSHPLEALDLLPVAHAHASSQKTLARPTNHYSHIPGYTLSSNPEHERFIGLDADDNRLLTQSLPFQSPSAPFRPTKGPSSFLQMQSQSYELPPTQHTQTGWVANSNANEPNRQFQPPYY